MSATTQATITLNLAVNGDKAWDAVASAITRIKDAAASIGKVQPLQLDPKTQQQVNDLTNKVKQLTSANDALQKKFDALNTSEAKVNATGAKVVKGTKDVATAAKDVAFSFDPMAAAIKDANDEQAISVQRSKDQQALLKAVTDKSDAYARSVSGLMMQQIKETGIQKQQDAALKNTQTELAGMITKLQGLSKVFMDSSRGRGAQQLLADLQAYQKAGQALPIDKLNQLKRATDGIVKSQQDWGNEMHTLAGRLTFYEQQMDAILRASYRFKAVGADLTRFAQNIMRGFQGVMQTFGEFDFNLRRAAGAVQIFEGTSVAGQNGLQLLSKAALDVAQSIKFIPVADVAKGFYFWGSMTGLVVKDMGDLNTLIEGHTAVLKAASMTEVGFEAALKGVYSILTQFYGGDLTKTVDVTEKLFYTAQTTAAEFGDLIQSFKMVGPVAHGLGASFESILSLIGDLSNFGIRGSMAGRAVRQIFIQLVKPSKQAAEALEGTFKTVKDGFDDLKKYGSYYDAIFPNGQYVGVEQHIKILAEMTKNMTVDQRAGLLATMSTANSLPVLMALVGRKVRELQVGIDQDMKTNYDKAKEYFNKNWQLLSDSWKGVVGSITRAWEALKVGIGAGIADFAKPIIEWLTTIVEKIRVWAEENPKVVAAFAKFAAVVAVLAAIGGALLTITGTLLGIGAASYVAIKSFIPSFGAMAKAVGDTSKELSQLRGTFVDMSKTGLKGFLGVIGVLIGLMDAVTRNAQYIQTQLNDAFKTLTNAGSGAQGIFDALVAAVQTFQSGVDLVFDQVVRRFADAVDAGAHLLDFIGKLVGGVQNLQGPIALVIKALGILFGISILNKFINFIPLLGAINKAFITWATTALGASEATGVLAASVRGLMASTGVGLLIVALSLVVDWIGQANQSLDDLKNKVDAAASSFGDMADAAKKAATDIATAQVDAQKSMTPKFQGNTGFAEQLTRNIFAFFGDEPAKAQLQAIANDALNADYNAFEKAVTDAADKQIEKWKGLVDHINFVWHQAGQQYHIDYSQFIEAYTKLTSHPDITKTLKPYQQEFVSEFLAALSPDASLNEISQAYNAMQVEAAKEFGGKLAISAQDFISLSFNQAAYDLRTQKEEGIAWGNLIKTAMQNAGIGSASSQADINKFLDTEITRSVIGPTGFATTVKETVRQLLGDKAIPEDVFAPIFTALLQGTDQLAQSVSDNPQAYVTQSVDALSKSFTDLLTYYVNSGLEQAIPGISQIVSSLNDTIGKLGTAFDPNQIFAQIFQTGIDGFNGRTFEDILLNGGVALPDALKKSLTDWATKLSEQGVPGATDLLKALKAGGDLGGNLDDAFKKFMDDAKSKFLDKLDGNIGSAYKDIKKELKQRLANPDKYGDKASIGKLLAQILDPTIQYGAHQTIDTKAQTDAYNFIAGNVEAIVGGIQTAIDNQDTTRAHKELQTLVENLATLPPEFFNSLPDDLKTQILTWIQGQTDITVPQTVLDGLKTSVQDQFNTALDGITITPKDAHLNFLQRFGEFNDGIVPGKPNFNNGGGTGTKTPTIPGMPTAADVKTSITNAVQSGVTSALPAIPGLAQPIGAAIMTGIQSGITAGTTAFNTSLNTLITNLSSKTTEAYNGGHSISWAWKNGLQSGFDAAVLAAKNAALAIKDYIGNSPPAPWSPLYHSFDGGDTIGTNWSKGLGHGLDKSTKDTNKHLKNLRKALSTAQGHVTHWQHELNTDTDRWEKAFDQQMLNDSKRAVTRAQKALDKYLGKHGNGTTDGNNGHSGGGTGTKGHTGVVGGGNRANIEFWKQQIRKYQKEIQDLFAGGLTEEEKRRKTYDEQLIDMYKSRIAHPGGGGNGTGNKPHKGKHGTDTHPNDGVGAPTVTNETKRTIEIHIDVESKDGSVTKVTQAQIRRAVMDSLSLSDLEHLVTVG